MFTKNLTNFQSVQTTSLDHEEIISLTQAAAKGFKYYSSCTTNLDKKSRMHRRKNRCGSVTCAAKSCKARWNFDRCDGDCASLVQQSPPKNRMMRSKRFNGRHHKAKFVMLMNEVRPYNLSKIFINLFS